MQNLLSEQKNTIPNGLYSRNYCRAASCDYKIQVKLLYNGFAHKQIEGVIIVNARAEAQKIVKFSPRYGIILNYLSTTKKASWTKIKTASKQNPSTLNTQTLIPLTLQPLNKGAILTTQH